jgi:hypothetical protein
MIEDLFDLIGGRSVIEAATSASTTKSCRMIICATSLQVLTWHTSGLGKVCSFPCSSADGCIQGKIFMTLMPSLETAVSAMRTSTSSSTTFAPPWKKWESNRRMPRKSENAWKVGEEPYWTNEIALDLRR